MGELTNVEKTGMLWAGMFMATALVGGTVGILVQRKRDRPLWKGAATGALAGVSMVPVTAIAFGIAATQGWILR